MLCNYWNEPRHDKTSKVRVRPAKTQISLGICPVWSESSLSAWRNLGSLATHWAHSEDWSDWADAQADLSLRWAHTHFVGFVMLWLKWSNIFRQTGLSRQCISCYQGLHLPCQLHLLDALPYGKLALFKFNIIRANFTGSEMFSLQYCLSFVPYHHFNKLVIPGPVARPVELSSPGNGNSRVWSRTANPQHTKVVKMVLAACSSLGTQTYGVELGLVRQHPPYHQP